MQVSHGSVSHCEPTVIGEAEEGLVTVAAVSSPCENVMHSLVNTRHYAGTFLPGFTEVEEESQDPATSDLLTHIDHVTYVCNMGDTERILAWYRDTAGMQRFLLSPDEDPEVGVVFEEVGMKLNVGDWVAEWLCREQGVHSGHTDEARNFKLVLAEPLTEGGSGHVDKYPAPAPPRCSCVCTGSWLSSPGPGCSTSASAPTTSRPPSAFSPTTGCSSGLLRRLTTVWSVVYLYSNTWRVFIKGRHVHAERRYFQ